MNSATGAAANVGAQAKAAAKQVAREAQILDKSAKLMTIDKELKSLGWSPSPEVKARKAELSQQRREVSQELAGLQQEVKANQEKAREAQRNRMSNLR
ncbi:MAG: hypothetical protein Q8S33_22495 [Myxococcales bacterium]|nr:hypothetical protein [Myxococcales bacterium]